MKENVDFGDGMIITQQQAAYQSDERCFTTSGLKKSGKNEMGYLTPPESTQNKSVFVWPSGNITVAMERLLRCDINK